MCGPGNADNIREMVDPVSSWLDGVIWVLHDCPLDDPGARYLALRTGLGRVIHRGWPTGRHWHSMNDTLYTGLIAEGDYVLWCDTLERPMPAFVSRIKTEIGPMMTANDVDVIAAWGKAYLMRYRETMEYRGSPHWSLVGHNGRGIEWSTIEPDETKVRFNARPLKRTSEWHWIEHYVRYYTAYPAGSNHCLLGLEKNGDPNALFPPREARRLAFRKHLVSRGVPLTVEGVKQWMERGADEVGKRFVREEKILNDAWRFWVVGDRTLVDNHDHKDLIPIL